MQSPRLQNYLRERKGGLPSSKCASPHNNPSVSRPVKEGFQHRDADSDAFWHEFMARTGTRASNLRVLHSASLEEELLEEDDREILRRQEAHPLSEKDRALRSLVRQAWTTGTTPPVTPRSSAVAPGKNPPILQVLQEEREEKPPPPSTSSSSFLRTDVSCEDEERRGVRGLSSHEDRPRTSSAVEILHPETSIEVNAEDRHEEDRRLGISAPVSQLVDNETSFDDDASFIINKKVDAAVGTTSDDEFFFFRPAGFFEDGGVDGGARRPLPPLNLLHSSSSSFLPSPLSPTLPPTENEICGSESRRTPSWSKEILVDNGKQNSEERSIEKASKEMKPMSQKTSQRIAARSLEKKTSQPKQRPLSRSTREQMTKLDHSSSRQRVLKSCLRNTTTDSSVATKLRRNEDSRYADSNDTQTISRAVADEASSAPPKTSSERSPPSSPTEKTAPASPTLTNTLNGERSSHRSKTAVNLPSGFTLRSAVRRRTSHLFSNLTGGSKDAGDSTTSCEVILTRKGVEVVKQFAVTYEEAPTAIAVIAVKSKADRSSFPWIGGSRPLFYRWFSGKKDKLQTSSATGDPSTRNCEEGSSGNGDKPSDEELVIVKFIKSPVLSSKEVKSLGDPRPTLRRYRSFSSNNKTASVDAADMNASASCASAVINERMGKSDMISREQIDLREENISGPVLFLKPEAAAPHFMRCAKEEKQEKDDEDLLDRLVNLLDQGALNWSLRPRIREISLIINLRDPSVEASCSPSEPWMPSIRLLRDFCAIACTYFSKRVNVDFVLGSPWLDFVLTKLHSSKPSIGTTPELREDIWSRAFTRKEEGGDILTGQATGKPKRIAQGSRSRFRGLPSFRSDKCQSENSWESTFFVSRENSLRESTSESIMKNNTSSTKRKFLSRRPRIFSSSKVVATSEPEPSSSRTTGGGSGEALSSFPLPQSFVVNEELPAGIFAESFSRGDGELCAVAVVGSFPGPSSQSK